MCVIFTPSYTANVLFICFALDRRIILEISQSDKYQVRAAMILLFVSQIVQSIMDKL